ncbi:MAG: bifunctional adenosylcobinamide kinase/adenosylcobinamide-phosphate guanylyltransferase [Lachnospiraceae bacterium]|nr:bifunctional adenosylcobinamide kinase/adenosylcobinamide-phosphate guanylyltransferase [Lachnospiraceae bacterium]
MIILVYGGSGSGKSAFAEKKITELNNSKAGIYYLATMKVYDEEDRERVKRHKRQRKDKNFITIEQPKDILEVLSEIKDADSDILLECMSNLAANELFSDKVSYNYSDDKTIDEEKRFVKFKKVFEKIKKDIIYLKDFCKNLVIVSNNVFEDGIRYEDETMVYIKLLGDINLFLSDFSDEVWEVVAGIPLRIK